jgi:hypothetical protein
LKLDEIYSQTSTGVPYTAVVEATHEKEMRADNLEPAVVLPPS